MMRRLFPHPMLSATLFLAWLLLAGSIALNSLLMAGFLAVLIPRVTRAFWPGRPKIRHPLRLVSYVALVVWDVILANIQVARIILFMPADQIKSAWITVPVDLPCPEAIALLAGTITLTPGTLTAEFSSDNKALLIHALHAPDPDATRDEIKSRYEARLQRIFR
ncbi:MAG: Na+/H+ antiporter subunit E [Cypionkella sp.]|uniref:Na+/H+ antiporter subunit E n=1 Tax=Cypionkella sp. TaxID=2811411 RepID=UPI002AB81C60|nr:Na+/H+ antiporter subunit E [Cypionkella sp.]MDZ4309864.1 Na+/H+ antiporter subunit E [Cypionkella sp.]MDZ4394399.1 Na+/H+ antiporter subunit E [Cypionkella sp.]